MPLVEEDFQIDGRMQKTNYLAVSGKIVFIFYRVDTSFYNYRDSFSSFQINLQSQNGNVFDITYSKFFHTDKILLKLVVWMLHPKIFEESSSDDFPFDFNAC